jgi:uncharacterized membrane protein YcjF (UPF0283 family)
MAKLIDTDGEIVGETTTFDDLEEQVAPVEEAPEASETPEEPESDLPDKYQGKSAADIARMHQELEKRLGQQSSEVGELRQAFDQMVQSSVKAQQAPPEVEEVSDTDFFADPKAAVAQAIENHPKLRQAEAVAVEMAKNQALAKLQTTHPDMKTILTSTDFQSWVVKSQFRQGLYQQADSNYDYAAADELLTLFKEAKGIVAEAAKIEKVAQKSAVKQASTGTSRSATEGKSRKVYRRRDIIELMNTDPKRYDAMSEEIMKAYREGRVK